MVHSKCRLFSPLSLIVSLSPALFPTLSYSFSLLLFRYPLLFHPHISSLLFSSLSSLSYCFSNSLSLLLLFLSLSFPYLHSLSPSPTLFLSPLSYTHTLSLSPSSYFFFLFKEKSFCMFCFPFCFFFLISFTISGFKGTYWNVFLLNMF